jgi:hypothetical protein
MREKKLLIFSSDTPVISKTRSTENTERTEYGAHGVRSTRSREHTEYGAHGVRSTRSTEQ